MSPLATQLSWAHIVEILPLKTIEAKLFYLAEASNGLMSKKALREMIYRKTYERREIANTQVTDTEHIPLNVFKDPYLFDILGLKFVYQR